MKKPDPIEAFAKYLTDGFEVLGASFRPVIPEDLKGKPFTIQNTGGVPHLQAPPSHLRPNQKAFDDFNTEATYNINIVPAMLAVKLGYDDQVIQELMELNGANIRDVSPSLRMYNEITGMCVDVHGRSLTKMQMDRRLCGAIAGSTILAAEAKQIFLKEQRFTAEAYHMMFFDNKDLWPSTRMAEQLPLKSTSSLNVFRQFYDAEDASDLPNGSLDDLFTRLGVTLPAIVNSKYFKPFFYEDLIERAYQGSQFASEVLTYGLTHPDPGVKKAFVRGVTYSLTFESTNLDGDDIDSLLKFIKNELESTQNLSHAQSLTTELNLLPEDFDRDEDELCELTYPALQDNKTIMKRLITELMEAEPGDVAYGQLHALSKLGTLHMHEQEVSGLDHAKATHYLLAAYRAFTDGDPKISHWQDFTVLHRGVHAGVETFLTHLSKEGFDYDTLGELTQGEILMLATAGFDMHKLPKMELPTLGKHFRNELGI